MTSVGEQRLFTSSSAGFTMLFCVQVTSEVLGEVLVVDKDGADRVRRVHARLHDQGASPSRSLAAAANVGWGLLQLLPAESWN